MKPAEAERRLLSLELFGMRFGLDRMKRLMTALEHPERSFRSIHVVGTNGKSSTVRMTAAILAHHGYRVGSYLSPHLVSYSERIRVDDRDLTPQEFADAIERAWYATEQVNRSAATADDGVTQFELLTAAAYSELARQGVGVAVIEAGLGGRYDATNVIPSTVQVLTGVGLEHTRWLGPTVTAIAREKLDVVQPGATLVLGPGMHPEALAVAEEVAAQRGARIVQAESDPHATVGALGTFQRVNFAVARAAAQAFLGELDEQAVLSAAADVRVPGRLQIIGQRPLTLLDGAHNPDGVKALVESLPEIVANAAGRGGVSTAARDSGGEMLPQAAFLPQSPKALVSANPGGERVARQPFLPQSRGRTVAVVSILDDKDAATMLATLASMADTIVLTASQNPRVLPPPTLRSLLEQSGGDVEAEIVATPHAALARARELAGPEGVVVAAGSLYLIADLLSDPATAATRRASTL